MTKLRSLKNEMEVKYANVDIIKDPTSPWTVLDEKKQLALANAKYYSLENMRPLRTKNGEPANAFRQLVYIADKIEAHEQRGIFRTYPEYIRKAAFEAQAAYKQGHYRKVEFIKELK